MVTNLILEKSLGLSTSVDTLVQIIDETSTKLYTTPNERLRELIESKPTTILIRDLAYIHFCYGVASIALEPHYSESGAQNRGECEDDVNLLINTSIRSMKRQLHGIMGTFQHLAPLIKPKQSKLIRFIEEHTTQLDLLLCWTIIHRFQLNNRDFKQSDLLPDMQNLVLLAIHTSSLLSSLNTITNEDNVVNSSSRLCEII